MRKSITLLLALVLAIVLVACSTAKTPSKKPGVDTPPTSSSVQEPSDTETNSNPEQETVPGTEKNPTDSQNKPNDNSGSSLDVKESVSYVSVPEPGTENWSGAENAYNLKISNESIGNFQYYGWFITDYEARFYDKLTKEQKELYNHYVFEVEKVNFICIMANSDFYYQNNQVGADYESFKENWRVGKDGIIDEIARRQIPVFATLDAIPMWMRGEGPYLLEKGMAEDFAKATTNLVCDLVEKAGLNVVYVSAGDEPDGADASGEITCVDHYSFLTPLIRKYLDERGFKNVGISGPETCNFSVPWLSKMRSMESAWENLDAISGHGFGFGIMSEAAMYQSRAYNMPIFITSTGIGQNGTLAGDFLETTSSGEDTIADYYSAIRAVVGLIHDVNLGANAYASWAPGGRIDDLVALDGFDSNWSHVYMNPDANVFSKGIAKSAILDYYSAVLQTVQPGAKIYHATSKDTDINHGSSKYDETTKMSANAGINPDGTWGINILNRTDSTILAPHRNEQYAAQPAAEETMIVDIDIVGLYGTGAKEFKMYSTDTSGNFRKEIGTITLVDGRGWVEVYPLELISLQSVEKIPVNNKPLVIDKEIKDLNVAFAGYDYIYAKGTKTKLNAKLEQSNNSDFRTPGIVFEAEDFANLIGGSYEYSNGVASIWNDSGMITVSAGNTQLKYSGVKNGAIVLGTKPELRNGKLYFTIQDSVSSTISEIFGIKYNQYPSSGVVVVGETDVVNISRFVKLFK